MNDFTAALAKAKAIVRDHGKTAAVTVRLTDRGVPGYWDAQLALEPMPHLYILAGYVSVTGLVRACNEAFSDAYRIWEPRG